MKKVHFSLFILGALSFYGCTLSEPLNLGVKCSDRERSLSAVVYNTTVCHSVDVTGDLKEVCGGFADAFKYGNCPPESPICIEEDGEFMCSTSHCKLSQYEENGVCKDNDVNNCGGAKVRCSENMAGWQDGSCVRNDSGVSCAATDCALGYKLNDADKKCEKVSECLEHEHLMPDESCEPDDVDNCGFYGNNCQKNITGWQNGQCEEGLCRLSACEDGYALEDGRCQPMIECQPTEHIYITEDSNCEMDTVSNCGHHGNDCTWLDGWSDGTCVEGRCVASACMERYELKSGICRFLTCEGDTHYYNQECESNSIEHCGRHDYNCEQRVPGWQSGLCIDGICEPSTCAAGYKSEAKSCVAVTTCDEHKHVSGENLCAADTVNACGSENNDCTRRAGWKDGACEAADCVASDCMEGYEVKDGQCVSAIKTCAYCASNEVCVDGRCVVTGCTQDCNTYQHATSGVCSLEGKCIATACEVGYHLYAGTCEVNSDANCGSHGNTCATVNQSVCQLERGVCVCPDGFVLGELGCMKQPIEYICDASNYTKVFLDGEMVRAYCLSSFEDLMAMQEGLSDLDYETWPEDNQRKAYVLTDDISLGSQEHWVPMTFPAEGILMGNHRTISGDLSCDDNCALFDSFQDAKISDININVNILTNNLIGTLAIIAQNSQLSNIQVMGKLESYHGDIGGVVHEMSDCIISYVVFGGSLKTFDDNCAGGIAVSSNYSNFSKCTFFGNNVASNAGGLIVFSNHDSIVGSWSFGEIYGKNIGGLLNISMRSSLLESGSTVSILGIGGGTSGGLINEVADDGGEISRCVFSGVIKGVFDRIGGLVSGLFEDGLIIKDSAFDGVISARAGVIGGIIGYASCSEGFMHIYNCGVFGLIDGIEQDSSIGGFFGKSNGWDDLGFVDVQTSMIAADIRNANNGAYIGDAIDTLHGYSTGAFSNVNHASTDVLNGYYIDEPEPNYYYWYEGATDSQMSSAEQIVYEGVSQQVGGKLLVDVLNESYRELNSTEEDGWETRLCEITTGPANGTPTMYELAVPKTMVSVPFCEQILDAR